MESNVGKGENSDNQDILPHHNVFYPIINRNHYISNSCHMLSILSGPKFCHLLQSKSLNYEVFMLYGSNAGYQHWS